MHYAVVDHCFGNYCPCWAPESSALASSGTLCQSGGLDHGVLSDRRYAGDASDRRGRLTGRAGGGLGVRDVCRR